MESLSEILENVSEALILCRVRTDDHSEILEVRAVNQRAREILDWTGNPVMHPPLEKIISSKPFIESMAVARASGTLVPGIVDLTSETLKHQISYAVKSIKNHILIRLEKSNMHLMQGISEHIQNNPLVHLIAFEAVRNSAGEIENFRLLYKNLAAVENVALRVSIEPGQYLTDWYPPSKQMGLFPQFKEVVETGNPLITERFYPEQEEGYEIVATKSGDGIIISSYNTIEKRKARRMLVDWQRIVNSSDDTIALLAPIRDKENQIIDFSIELVNQSAKKICQTDWKDKNAFTISQIPTVSKEQIVEYSNVVETGVSLRTEGVVPGHGEDLYLDISVSRLNGKLLVIAKDITSNRKVIQDLERHQKLLDGIINTSENLMFVAKGTRDGTGRLLDLNIVKQNQRASNAFSKILGLSILGQSPKKVLGEQQELCTISLRVMESGKPVTIEQHYEERLGRWYRIFFRKVEEYLVVTYADITEIQEARLEAEHRNTLMSAIMENSLDGVVAMEAIRNTQGVIIDFAIRMVNQLAKTVTVLPEESLIGNTYGILFPQVVTNGFHKELIQAAQARVSLRREHCFYFKESNMASWFDLSMTPASNDLFVLSFRDITELVGWRREQERLLNELKRSNKSLEQFAYVASHDLQEPTRKIRAFGSLLVKQFASLLPESAQDLIKRMVSASERMQGMIDSLLMYSRFSNQPRQTALVSLKKSVDQVLMDLDIAIKESDAEVVVGELPVITGNETQLYQLFLNLINNALKFSNKSVRTCIGITAGPPSSQEIKDLGFDAGLSWHAIRVADNGIGFDESNRMLIFELFRRLHGQSEYSGSGMGLAICKVVVEQHGGGITVYSTPGVGTTFVVLLPASAV